MPSRSSNKKSSTAKRGGRPGSGRTSAKAHGAPPVRPARWTDWLSAARPATLGLAVAPVILGWGVTSAQLLLDNVDPFGWFPELVTVLALVVAVTLQVGVNFANDYSDGIRGTDANRAGPARLTASGRAPAHRVRLVAFAFFGAAAIAGLVLTVVTQIWWLPAVGLAALTAGWYYTGGKRPYGYRGLGEIVVFLFFGLVASTGTAFVIAQAIWPDALLAGAVSGLFAAAVLHINNVRDRATDIESGKRTLATRLPEWVNRTLFTAMVTAPFGILVAFITEVPNAAFAFFALIFIAPAILITWTSTSPREHVLILKLTVWASLFYALLVAWAFAF